MPKTFVIFSGYNQRAVIALLRKLSDKKIEHIIIASGQHDTILKTTHKRQVKVIRQNKELNIKNIRQALGELRIKFPRNEFIFAPTTESLNRLFLENPEVSIDFALTIPLVDIHLYAKISNKMPFSNLCRKFGIKVPSEFSNPANCLLPFVAKQREYKSQDTKKPIFLLTEKDRIDFLKSENAENFYFQEFINGSSHYLLAHINRDGRSICFSQKNLIQQANGKSIIAAKVDNYHQTQDSKRYIEMLKECGFFGLIMIEVRKKGDDYYMIEANPRLWGPTQLYLDAMDYDLLDAFLEDNGFLLHPKKKIGVNDYYFWYEGYAEDINEGRSPTFHNYTPDEFCHDLPKLLDNEIHARADTMALFLKKLNKKNKSI